MAVRRIDRPRAHRTRPPRHRATYQRPQTSPEARSSAYRSGSETAMLRVRRSVVPSPAESGAPPPGNGLAGRAASRSRSPLMGPGPGPLPDGFESDVRDMPFSQKCEAATQRRCPARGSRYAGSYAHHAHGAPNGSRQRSTDRSVWFSGNSSGWPMILMFLATSRTHLRAMVEGPRRLARLPRAPPSLPGREPEPQPGARRCAGQARQGEGGRRLLSSPSPGCCRAARTSSRSSARTDGTGSRRPSARSTCRPSPTTWPGSSIGGGGWHALRSPPDGAARQ